MGFHFKVGAVTDVGKVRAINEDCFCIDDNLGLFQVADGVGGENAGEVASNMAIEIVQHHVSNSKDPLTGMYREELSLTTNRILSGIRLANDAIYEAGEEHPEKQGMATTISAVRINGHVMALGHVGDSRIYRIRGDYLQRLTEDHSLIEEQLKHGLITEEEAANSIYKNALLRALGSEETIMIDADEEVLLDHDRILLCTDGLTNMVREEDIVRIILDSKDDPQNACQELVDRAKDNGGADNITVVLVHCKKTKQREGLLGKVVWFTIDGLGKIYRGVQSLFMSEKKNSSSHPEDTTGTATL